MATKQEIQEKLNNERLAEQERKIQEGLKKGVLRKDPSMEGLAENVKKSTKAPKHNRSVARKLLSKEGRRKNKAAMKKIAKAEGIATAFAEIDLSKDWPHWIIIAVSIIADLFSAVPYAGNLFSIFFAVVIWVLYLLFGHFSLGGKKAVKKMARRIAVILGSHAAEIFLVFINIFPFFLGSALVNYWFDLADRRETKLRMKMG